MSTMSDAETYNGWKNRETWAFNLHWSNDQGLYNETMEVAAPFWHKVSRTPGTNEQSAFRQLGDYIVTYWRDFIDGYADNFGSELPEGLVMFDREVGSWWRIDHAETGAAIREALSNEGEG